MEFEELGIKGVWLVTHQPHDDERGSFREWFKSSEVLVKTGREFQVAQSNISTSKKNVLRGIHYSIAPEGQAKWVTCITGSILDVVVDLRPDSDTFKQHVKVELNSMTPQSLLVSEGLGHSFLALEEDNVVSYLLTSSYIPHLESGINPFDPELNIIWPRKNIVLSDKDRLALPLSDSLRKGQLNGN